MAEQLSRSYGQNALLNLPPSTQKKWRKTWDYKLALVQSGGQTSNKTFYVVWNTILLVY